MTSLDDNYAPRCKDERCEVKATCPLHPGQGSGDRAVPGTVCAAGTSYIVSDADERAWCIVCGAEFCPNGRYADSDDQAEMCEGCESASAQHKPNNLV